jgi:hypothetical protein
MRIRIPYREGSLPVGAHGETVLWPGATLRRTLSHFAAGFPPLGEGRMGCTIARDDRPAFKRRTGALPAGWPGPLSRAADGWLTESLSAGVGPAPGFAGALSVPAGSADQLDTVRAGSVRASTAEVYLASYCSVRPGMHSYRQLCRRCPIPSILQAGPEPIALARISGSSIDGDYYSPIAAGSSTSRCRPISAARLRRRCAAHPQPRRPRSVRAEDLMRRLAGVNAGSSV